MSLLYLSLLPSKEKSKGCSWILKTSKTEVLAHVVLFVLRIRK
jgi:hypothetical protein